MTATPGPSDRPYAPGVDRGTNPDPTQATARPQGAERATVDRPPATGGVVRLKPGEFYLIGETGPEARRPDGAA